MACTTIRAGLKSGTLKEAMEHISEVYTAMARERITIAVGTFTWFLFSVIAIFVAITVLGFFSAVYGVIQSVH
jgi:type II secretory pathway component PulF